MTSKEALSDLLNMADYCLEEEERKQIKKEHALIEKDLEILDCFRKIPKQDLLDFINWQIRYEKNLNTWLKSCNFDLGKEEPTKHLIKIKEWLENEK